MSDGGASGGGTPRDEPVAGEDALSESSSFASEASATATGATGADPTGTFGGGDVVEGQAPVEPPGGSKIQRYVIVEKIGHGGMSVVYKAYDPELNRRVAIKLLRPKGNAGTGGSTSRLRLVREAQALAQLSHPNVIAVHDVGT